MRQTIRSWRLHLRSDKTLDDLSRMFNPILRGWVNYDGQQQFPLIPCEYYATMVADSSASVSTIRVCLLKQRLGSEMTGRLVERGLMW